MNFINYVGEYEYITSSTFKKQQHLVILSFGWFKRSQHVHYCQIHKTLMMLGVKQTSGKSNFWEIRVSASTVVFVLFFVVADSTKTLYFFPECNIHTSWAIGVWVDIRIMTSTPAWKLWHGTRASNYWVSQTLTILLVWSVQRSKSAVLNVKGSSRKCVKSVKRKSVGVPLSCKVIFPRRILSL